MKLNISQVLQQATIAHNEGKIQEAESFYRTILKTQPKHADANHNLGLIIASKKNSSDSVSLFKIAVEVNPNIEQFWISYTTALINEKHFKEAEINFKKLLELKPGFAIAHNNFGVLLQNLGRYDESEVSIRKAIELNPDFVDAYYNLGVCLSELGRLDEVVVNYKKAITLKPDFVVVYSNLSAILKNLGKFDEAEASARKAIEIKPDFSEAYYNLGVTLHKTARFKEAEASYKKSIELKPDYVDAYVNLGAVLKEIANPLEAMANYKKAIDLKPNSAHAHYNLGLILYELGKFKEAIEEFKLSSFKNSKELILSCLLKLDEKSLFYQQLDDLIERGNINPLIGSLITRAEVKFKTKRPNLFCKNPLKYILKTNLTESCDFKTIFVKTIKDVLDNDLTSFKSKQLLLTKGNQTTGNIFLTKNGFIDEIQKTIRLEIDKYRTHFKDSEEGFLKNWPSNYDLYGWLVSMKSGGSLSAHMHENGWVSGSLYINVPPKLKVDSGNLVVCIDEKNDLEENKKSIDVVTGSLCLFPSSLHHYTIPFESNEERIVLAFDVIPK